jgi:hypothetical protein
MNKNLDMLIASTASAQRAPMNRNVRIGEGRL